MKDEGTRPTSTFYITMKKANITNIVLGIIAAEVVFQTVQAIADRQLAVGKYSRPEEQPKPQKAGGHFFLGAALQQAIGLLRCLFFGSKSESTRGAQCVREGVESHGPQDAERKFSGKQGSVASYTHRDAQPADNEEHEEEGVHLKGSMEGIAEKLKDPAWVGVLAANDGNVSLTDSQRAVPMPNSAQFLQRLDKNPFIGKGMRDHSRDKI